MSDLFSGRRVNEILPLFETELTEQFQLNDLTAKVIALLTIEVGFPYHFQQHLNFALRAALGRELVFQLNPDDKFVAFFTDPLGDYVTSTYTIKKDYFELLLVKGEKEDVYRRKLTRHSQGLLFDEVEEVE